MTTKPSIEAGSVREALVTASRDAWKKRLIDLSRRNNLLYYRPLVNGTLELPVSPDLAEFLASGKQRALSELSGGKELSAANVRTIVRKGLENLEEKGLLTLFLALGRCSWAAEDGGRDAFAPILLFPVRLNLKGHDIDATEIEVVGAPEVNPVLLHVLQEELNVRVDAEEVLDAFHPELNRPDGEDSEESDVDPQAILTLMAERARKVSGFAVQPFAVIGNFSFQKLAMVKDLENRLNDLVTNEVVAAIAGDAMARAKLSASHVDVDPRTLDAVPPDLEFAVMEADSSQQAAISGIVAGQSAVVHGPPGTGKSQTITNLVATLAANGKKVLFVAEKRAALEVVMNRLISVGLDHLAIDLHGADLAPKKVMEQVAKTLAMVRDAVPPSVDGVHVAFNERRERLNHHEQRVHAVHAPTGLSVYDMQGLLLRLPPSATSPLRWRGPELDAITDNKAKEIRDLLGEAAALETFFNRSNPSPWSSLDLADAYSAQRALDLAIRLAHQELPRLVDELGELTRKTGLVLPQNMEQAARLLKILEAGNEILTEYQAGVFAVAQEMAENMAPGHSGGIAAWWFRLTDGRYKRAIKEALALRSASARGAEIFDEMKRAAEVQAYWHEQGSGAPREVDGVEVATQVCERVRASIEEAAMIFLFLPENPLAQILDYFQKLASEENTPYLVSRVCEIEKALKQRGAERLIAEIRSARLLAKDWIPRFEYIWLSSTLDLAALADAGIKAFIGSRHNGYVEDFKKLDTDRIRLAADRVRRAHGERAIAVMNQYPEQESVIRSEAAKSRRHKPLRRIFAEASDVLTAVCPCWMASPLSVCQLLGTNSTFDYVIFDEASQILPEDAIPSIIRARHVIVAGDNKQLPPTTFFAASEEDTEEENADGTGYESLLDMMIPFVRGFHLNWHYRSRDESLIAFSNHKMYDNRLVTFPGAGAGKSISHVYVNAIPSSDGQEESSAAEVEKVVRLILEHARKTPSVTLGVITMGIKHANRLQAALDRMLNGGTDFSDFFDTGRPERFFIKNLERVQGDERDAIILSIGYGKNRAGNLPLNFGPILSAGGRRRLNVAVTRAKQTVTVVSSFLSSDIDSTKVRPGTGLEFLKNYLEYAQSGGSLFSNGELSTEPMNGFELDVYEALTASGIKLVPQLGCSSFRIDFAVCHPASPGKYVLAIECDGASYHSGYTARDRDRLRQQQLEKLGWTFHRIWSTDWFLRRQEEIERTMQAYHRAVQKSQSDNGSAVPVFSPTPKAASTSADPTPAVRCSPMPPIAHKKSIDEYSDADLQNLLHWIRSDGKLRSNDELADAMFEELPFARRGARIDAAIRRALGRQ